ncbi:MAG: transposase [Phycisphaerae bacterium]
MKKFARFCVAAAVVAGVSGFVARASYAEETKPAAEPPREAIDFRKLKELMPEELGGLKRSKAGGEKNKFGDMSVSNGRATYGKADDGEDENVKNPRIEVEISDFGGSAANVGAAAAMWSTLDIDQESDDGYEKTLKIGDAKHPAYEKWNKADKHGEIQVWVAKRYVLTIRTSNLTSADTLKIANAFPVGKLADLK